MTRCKVADKTDMGCEVHNFGIKDERGREFGARIYFWKVELIEIDSMNDLLSIRQFNKPAGYYFLVRMQSARNGQKFGAFAHEKWFTTEAERDAAVMKYLKGARSRALKIAK